MIISLQIKDLHFTDPVHESCFINGLNGPEDSFFK